MYNRPKLTRQPLIGGRKFDSIGFCIQCCPRSSIFVNLALELSKSRVITRYSKDPTVLTWVMFERNNHHNAVSCVRLEAAWNLGTWVSSCAA